MIIREGSHRVVLMTKDGKRVLGNHSSVAQAKAQEAAINISKARKAGHNIPSK